MAYSNGSFSLATQQQPHVRSFWGSCGLDSGDFPAATFRVQGSSGVRVKGRRFQSLENDIGEQSKLWCHF